MRHEGPRHERICGLRWKAQFSQHAPYEFQRIRRDGAIRSFKHHMVYAPEPGMDVRQFLVNQLGVCAGYFRAVGRNRVLSLSLRF